MIKFRVFDKPLKRYLYTTNGIDFDDGVDSYKYEDIGYFLESPNLYVCQEFTGIFDMHGNEIYEGDILAEEHDLDKDCMYGDEETYIKHHIVRKAPGYFTHDEDDKFSLISNAPNGINSYVEVIGNIYENPELVDPNDLV